ncbi:MAG: hypothetical protein JXB29_08480 [Sedimentisphaerales bacterium]|nr:hypothetical protein [Sedimentisphaerales bacterium]
MEVKLACLADYASITREGKLNILGIFDTINAPSFPFALPVFYVVISFEAGAAEFDTEKNVGIALCDEDGNALFNLEQTLKIARPNRMGSLFTTNQIGAIIGFPFSQSGHYQFAILTNGETKKLLSLTVNEIKPKDQKVG